MRLKRLLNRRLVVNGHQRKGSCNGCNRRRSQCDGRLSGPELRELKARIEAAERQVREREIQDLARRVSAAEDQLRRVGLTDEIERNG